MGSPAPQPIVTPIGSPLMRRRGDVRQLLRGYTTPWRVRHPKWLNQFGACLTVVDVYGAPGDTLVTAMVCRILHERFPRLRLNCITSNPKLLAHDPNIATINRPETFFSIWSWYSELGATRDGTSNLISKTLNRLGLRATPSDYKSKVYLTEQELRWARDRLGKHERPILTFHTRSRVEEKNWPLDCWRTVLSELARDFQLVQLGDNTEPVIPDVLRFAGLMQPRESMALLAHAAVHVGSVSFLMHAANGLDIPSVIIYGGRETPANSGYALNINLFSTMECGPCWLPYNPGDRCPHGVACMKKISPAEVIAAVHQQAKRSSARSFAAVP